MSFFFITYIVYKGEWSYGPHRFVNKWTTHPPFFLSIHHTQQPTLFRSWFIWCHNVSAILTSHEGVTFKRMFQSVQISGQTQLICCFSDPAVCSWNGKLKIIFLNRIFLSNYCTFMQIYASFSFSFYIYCSQPFQMGPGKIWETTNQLSLASTSTCQVRNLYKVDQFQPDPVLL